MADEPGDKKTPEPLPFDRTGICLVLGLLLPGAGHFALGRRFIGIGCFLLITAVWATGYAMTDGACVHRQVHPYAFYAQMGAPGYALLALGTRPALDRDRLERLRIEKNRANGHPEPVLAYVEALVLVGQFHLALQTASAALADESPADVRDAARRALLTSPPLLVSRDQFDPVVRETPAMAGVRQEAERLNARKVSSIDLGLLCTMVAGLLNALLAINVIQRGWHGGFPPPRPEPKKKKEAPASEEVPADMPPGTAIGGEAAACPR